jgi:hypothetical protein
MSHVTKKKIPHIYITHQFLEDFYVCYLPLFENQNLERQKKKMTAHTTRIQ